ncbi:hypothetical protein QA600_18635 [Natronococcus sp. A-GB1]|uniref:hypothetical protein n=1 Tax=Natronococcus sp. A-GB1 TaxID=3037648 RepID=UPI00241CCDE1|nr:hypothetical protein [Natronococcus sp. A-GB1]MDG5761351.1 hypothetical protein [Natronococcus sp. A-GB1]
MAYVDYDLWDGQDADLSWTAVAQLLERSQSRETDRVDAELDRIDQQLARRDRIHTEIVDELEWEIERYTAQLERLYRSTIGTQHGERTAIKDRLVRLQQDRREEQRRHWRDRQELERERRDLLRDLAAIEDEDLSELL